MNFSFKGHSSVISSLLTVLLLLFSVSLPLFAATDDEIPAMIRRGYELFTGGKFEEAEKVYKEIIKRDPANFQANFSLGIVYEKLKRPDLAMEHLEICEKLRPDYSPTYNNIGWIYFTAGDYERAQSYFYKAVRLDPGYLLASINLANVFLITDQPDMAVFLYREVLRMSPDNDMALNGLGIALFQKGSLDESEACFNRVLQNNPGQPAPLINLSLIYQKRGHWQKARLALERVIRENPGQDGAYYGLGDYYFNMGNRKKAFTYFEKTVTLSPFHFGAHQQMALILTEWRRYDEALLHLYLLRRIAPKNVSIMTETARVLYLKGSYKVSLQLLDEGLKIRPGDPQIQLIRGRVFEALNKNIEAVLSYEEALRADAGNVDALTALAGILVSMNRFTDAKSILNRAIPLNISDYRIFLLEAIIFHKKGNLSQSAKSLATAGKIDPQGRGGLFSAALYDYYTGKQRKALEILKNLSLKNQISIKEMEKFPRIKIQLDGKNHGFISPKGRSIK